MFPSLLLSVSLLVRPHSYLEGEAAASRDRTLMSRSYIRMAALWVSDYSLHMTHHLAYRSSDFPCPPPQTSRNPSSSGIGAASSMPSASASRRGPEPGHYVMIR